MLRRGEGSEKGWIQVRLFFLLLHFLILLLPMIAPVALSMARMMGVGSRLNSLAGGWGGASGDLTVVRFVIVVV